MCKCGPEDHKILDQDKEHVRKIGRLFDDEHVARYQLSKMTVSRTKLLNAPDTTAEANGKEEEEGEDKRGEPNGTDEDSQITFEWVPQGATVETVS